MSLRMPSKLSKPKRADKSLLSTTNILILAVTHAIAFLLGTMTSSNSAFQAILQHKCLETSPIRQSRSLLNSLNATTCKPCPLCVTVKKACKPCPTAQTKDARNREDVIPRYIKTVAKGMAHTTRKSFGETFDLGIPFESTSSVNDRDILIMYAKNTAMPNKMQVDGGNKKIEFIETAEEAFENCDNMRVVYLYRGGGRNICLAVVPQYESFHIQNWMRVPKKGPGNSSYPLRLVGRGQQWSGTDDFEVPKYEKQTKLTWPKLKTYLESLPGLLKQVKDIVNAIKVNNTVVVMVCNHGQSELLLNFACSAKARGFPTQNILVFATDPETRAIAESVGFTALYDVVNFGYMTSEAAGEYGDEKFVQMMFAKVLCVHLVGMTGIDFLFQDVDIVWFKDPMPYFLDDKSDYDAYFQDDGARSMRYSPWAANSGFYFIRNNPRTQYFLSQMVLAGDLILQTYSHQQAMAAILSEHASLYGLKVKILNRDYDGFPGGFHYHQKGENSYFRQYFNGNKDPYMFHMSWTFNKDNKLFFLKQLGEWYVHDPCVGKKMNEISHGGKPLSQVCCSAEPLFSCHFRDKPSKHPCSDSPVIDKDGKDFWQTEKMH